jgi:hypothetical protein
MYDEDLTHLEDWLRRLKVEFDIFFNGHRKKPPDDLKLKLERLLKKLGEAGDMSFQERFRCWDVKKGRRALSGRTTGRIQHPKPPRKPPLASTRSPSPILKLSLRGSGSSIRACWP